MEEISLRNLGKDSILFQCHSDKSLICWIVTSALCTKNF